MGICDSSGVIYDFAGPFYISRDNMAFGLPTRYVQLQPSHVRTHHEEAGNLDVNNFDVAVAKGCAKYSTRMHNICCDNCNSHVAQCLVNMNYRGHSRWSMVQVAALLFFRGKHVSTGRAFWHWAPFFCFFGLLASVQGLAGAAATVLLLWSPLLVLAAVAFALNPVRSLASALRVALATIVAVVYFTIPTLAFCRTDVRTTLSGYFRRCLACAFPSPRARPCAAARALPRASLALAWPGRPWRPVPAPVSRRRRAPLGQASPRAP